MSFSLNSIPLHSSFLELGNEFLSEVSPTAFNTESIVVHFNKSVAQLLDLQGGIETEKNFTDVFSGKIPLQDASPFAMLYAGHQFGHLNPQLGDGRAIVIAEIENASKQKSELQLKGSGVTPYSRGADGRAVLRSTIREYLCSEAMHGLGIATTRALCMMVSDDEVYREKIERGAILTRVAPSHVRFGSFEIFYYRHQYDNIRKLADHIIQQHYPELLNEENAYLAMLVEVIKRTAILIAQWQSVGFAHGVMNTDNMSILGITLDYGPYGFLDAYDPSYICNHSDHEGRYAFDQQPNIGLFNLSCLAQSLLPLIDDDSNAAAEQAKKELENYKTIYANEYSKLMRKKLGLENVEAQDKNLLESLLSLMTDDKVDHTIFFRQLCDFNSIDGTKNNAIRDMFIQRDIYELWSTRYKTRLHKEKNSDEQRSLKMKTVNPKFILRNYMAEVAIKKAEQKDYSEIDKLFTLLQNPFDEQPENESYAAYPPEWAEEISVSCSS